MCAWQFEDKPNSIWHDIPRKADTLEEYTVIIAIYTAV